MEEKKNWLGPYIPEGSIFRELIQQVKLAYSLILDPRVHPLTKLIPVAAVAYLILPTDLIPDIIPILGQADDVMVLMIGLRLFFEFSPNAVVQEHLQKLAAHVKGNWSVVNDPLVPGVPPAENGEVIDDGQ